MTLKKYITELIRYYLPSISLAINNKKFGMKKIVIILGLFSVLLLNCRKTENEKLYLNIISAEWYTKSMTFNNNLFCEVHLKIKGTSNAGLLSIAINGDGLIGCKELRCDSTNIFNEDVLICFVPERDSTKGIFGTILTAYSSKNKPSISVCEAVGSGDTLSKELESPFLICK